MRSIDRDISRKPTATGAKKAQGEIYFSFFASMCLCVYKSRCMTVAWFFFCRGSTLGSYLSLPGTEVVAVVIGLMILSCVALFHFFSSSCFARRAQHEWYQLRWRRKKDTYAKNWSKICPGVKFSTYWRRSDEWYFFRTLNKWMYELNVHPRANVQYVCPFFPGLSIVSCWNFGSSALDFCQSDR